MPRFLRTLHAQTLLAFVLAGILPVALGGLVLVNLGQAALTQQSARELTGLAKGLAGEIELYVKSRLGESRAVASLPQIASMDPVEQAQALAPLFFELTEFTRLSTFDLSGERTASSHTGDAAPQDAEALLAARLQGEQIWVVAAAALTGRRSLLIATPIRNATREVVGAVGAVVDLANLAKVVSQTEIGGGGRALVLDSAGRVLLHPEAEVMAEPEAYAWPGLTGASRPAGPGTFTYLWRGQPYVASFVPIASLGWTVVVEQPEREVLAPVVEARLVSLAALSLSLVFALSAAILLVRRLTRPLNELAHAARAFGAGEADIPLTAEAGRADEVAVLFSAFSEMRAAVSTALRRERSERVLNQTILGNVPTGLLVVTRDLRVLSANQAWIDIVGLSLPTVLSQPLEVALPDDELRARVSAFTEGREGQTNFVLDRSNPQRLLRVFISRTRTAAGDEERLLVGLEDLTPIAEIQLRYRALETLQQISQLILSTGDLRATVQAILQRAAATGPFEAGVVRLVNTAHDLAEPVASFGFAAPDGLRAHPPDGPLLTNDRQVRVYERPTDPGVPAEFAAEALAKVVVVPIQLGGQVLGTLALGSRLARTFSPNELELFGAIGSQVGIAVQKARLDDALRQSEAEARLLSLVASRTDNAVIIADSLGRVEWVNEGFTRITGYRLAEMRGRTPGSVLQGPASDPETVAYMRGRIARGENFRCEIINYTKAGTPYWIAIEGQPIMDEGTRTLRFMALETDITQRKQAQQALALANQELEQALSVAQQMAEQAASANRAKNEFLSRMSHELRTPMNAILGFAQLLEMDRPPAHQAGPVEQILKAGRHLLELINEVLDISRIEAGRLTFSLEPVAVAGLVRESVDMVRPMAAERGLTLESEAAAACPDYVRADNNRLKQVLVNLLANAIKFNTPGGSVTVTVAPVSDNHLRLSVTDTGPGISADKLDRLFTPFDRLDADKFGVEGTGLGLALSKRLVEVMGGLIGVHSAPGRGSTFWVELPLTQPEPPNPLAAAAAPATPPPGAATVLYVEDNLSNLRLIEHILSRRPKVRLISAMQGRLGLELAREHRPDLILLDIHLPDVQGDEVLRLLKQDPEMQAIPVVILTADALSGWSDRLLDQGAAAFMTKPIHVREFLDLLDTLLTQRAAHGPR